MMADVSVPLLRIQLTSCSCSLVLPLFLVQKSVSGNLTSTSRGTYYLVSARSTQIFFPNTYQRTAYGIMSDGTTIATLLVCRLRAM